MLDNLLESMPRRGAFRSGLPGTSVSIALHGVLIYAAVVATLHAEDQLADARSDTTRMIFVPDEPKPRAPNLALQEPPCCAAIVPPATVPLEIPPIDPAEVIDSRTVRRARTGLEMSALISPDTAPNLGQPVREAAVDEKPEALSRFTPDYPDLLRQAGIEGSVVVEAVIDTTGYAEPNSLRVVQSTNKAFELSAREAVLRTVYRPGRVRGRAVRVLVQVPIAFTMGR